MDMTMGRDMDSNKRQYRPFFHKSFVHMISPDVGSLYLQ